MVGDRLDSDMMFAHNADFRKMLVLSGCTSQEDVLALKHTADEYPDVVVRSLSMLFKADI